MQIPVKIPPKAREGSVRFRRVQVQMVRFRRVPGQILCEVPEGSGAETL